QGAATLILGPTDAGGGRVSVLIDAGNVTQFGHLDGGRLVAEALNTYGVTRLDYFIATHYHSDHIGGLATDGIEGWRYGSCFMFGLDGVPGTTEDDDEDGNANWEADGEPDLGELGLGAFHDDILVDTFVDRGAVVEPTSVTYGKYADVRTTAQVGTVSLSYQQDVDAYGIGLGASGATQATLTCLAANGYVRNRSARVPGVSDEDERNLCFWLSFGNFHYLIGGDATGGGDSTAEIEQAVGHYLATLQTPVTIDVLAVNHHGSNTSSATAFLTDVRPEVAVISVGNKNSDDHPDPDALQRLYDEEVQTIYQTEWGTTADEVPDYIEDIREVLEGDVVITSDGESFWVAEEPVADFSATPTSGLAPLTVAFTDLSENDPDTWEWNFGHGDPSSDPNPTHVYNDPGTYTVTLTVSNVGGEDTETKENYITVG
ncbi:MAG: PKD domain-containing protein, partial [Planctomycetes bacterium]|nr:PKD domain-containing protein [Planctomycetota bacterium]